MLLLITACDKDMSVMLDNSATSNVGVTMIDSFTVKTSTIQLDNLPTQATGTLLVGKSNIQQVGSMESSAFFRIGFSDFTNDIPQGATFDSLNLVLKPNASRYYFGDTTVTQKINVHQVTETIETTSLSGGINNIATPIYVSGASIFSKQKFTYDSTPLGSVSFLPRIASMDSLSIKLSPTLGQDFFDLVINNDMRARSNENFQDYFKGLAIVPDTDNSLAIGFSDTVRVNINYSYTGADGFKKNGAKTLSIVQKDLQHNYIHYDRSETVFETLSLTNKEIATSATGGLTYLQAGTGVVAKMTFPSLQDFVRDDNISINKAELVIESASSGSNAAQSIPGSLMLFVANYDGIPTSYVRVPYATAAQQANFVPGNQTGRNGTYTFNMIEYLKILKSSDTYDQTSLYLSPLVGPATFSTLSTALIATENGAPKIKLNILYTKFK
ncbi:DUF4270 family protein [Sphingobacterium wenxiniae]|uniref:DUF4270 domain-containing protein n=1 Tax=Sphingobacterium wenxiniae TaxID=683125 RepID=A0A1I6S115_9SPHI|nr:DUF4270 family protein [Sphingobacterium wenxiniae]SFS70627.1 protein of unknown function [Sphingobacterium wenxiniae]